MHAQLRRAGAVVALVLVSAEGCARSPGRPTAQNACEPSAYALDAGDSAGALTGTFALTLVATTGDSAGRRIDGRMTLRPASRPDAALTGSTDARIEGVAAYRVGSLDATTDSAPGVLVFATPGDRPSFTLRFGSAANARETVRFEGEYTVLTVHRIDPERFAGSWRSGANLERATGYFCARRLE